MLDKICEEGKASLLADAKQFVSHHRDEPMLKALGFDGTPLTTMEMRQCSFNGRVYTECSDTYEQAIILI